MKHFKFLTIGLLFATLSFASAPPAYSSPGVEKTVIKKEVTNLSHAYTISAAEMPAFVVVAAIQDLATFNFIPAGKELRSPAPAEKLTRYAPDISFALLKPGQYNLKRSHAIKAYLSNLFKRKTHNTLTRNKSTWHIIAAPYRLNC